MLKPKARPPLDADTFTGEMQWAVRWFNIMTEADRIGSLKRVGMARFWDHAKRGDYGAAQQTINEIREAIGC